MAGFLGRYSRAFGVTVLGASAACSRTGLEFVELRDASVTDTGSTPEVPEAGPPHHDAAVPPDGGAKDAGHDAQPLPPSTGDGWRQYGHDARHSGRSAATIRVQPELIWKADIGSSEIVVDSLGRVYVVAKTLTAIGADGTILWEHPYGDDTPAGIALQDDDSMVTTFWGGHVLALTTEGKEAWKLSIPHGPSMFRVTRPTVASDGTILFCMWSDLPVPGDDAVTLHAVSRDGALLWSSTLAHTKQVTQPAIAEDGSIWVAVFTSASFGIAPSGAKLLKLSDKGQHLASTAIGLGENPSELVAPSVALDGNVYVGSWGGMPNLFAFGSGAAALWKLGNPGLFAASPATDALGRVYAGTAWGVWMYSPAGQEVWSVSDGPEGNGKLSLWTPIALSADGAVVFQDYAGYVGAVRDGKLDWYEPMDGKKHPHGGVAIGPDGTVVAGAYSAVYAYR